MIHIGYITATRAISDQISGPYPISEEQENLAAIMFTEEQNASLSSLSFISSWSD